MGADGTARPGLAQANHRCTHHAPRHSRAHDADRQGRHHRPGMDPGADLRRDAVAGLPPGSVGAWPLNFDRRQQSHKQPRGWLVQNMGNLGAHEQQPSHDATPDHAGYADAEAGGARTPALWPPSHALTSVPRRRALVATVLSNSVPDLEHPPFDPLAALVSMRRCPCGVTVASTRIQAVELSPICGTFPPGGILPALFRSQVPPPWRQACRSVCTCRAVAPRPGSPRHVGTRAIRRRHQRCLPPSRHRDQAGWPGCSASSRSGDSGGRSRRCGSSASRSGTARRRRRCGSKNNRRTPGRDGRMPSLSFPALVRTLFGKEHYDSPPHSGQLTKPCSGYPQARHRPSAGPLPERAQGC